ncbi:MAG: serine/threonine-protein kinase [Isosphaeraceae bacterium]|jgi:serine/threonine-protein kinase
MMSQADNRTPTNRAAIDADLDDEIELEPTIQQPRGFPSSASESFHMALATSSMPSLTTETGELLRSRLNAATLFLAVAYGLFFLLGVVEPTSTHGQIRIFLGLRMSLCIAVAALLASPVVLSLRQLRALEYGFFGIMVLAIVITQYIAGSELIERGDQIRLVGLEKSGVLNFLILMVLYGVFIPNEPKNTASMVLTMAMAPLVVLALLSAKAAGSSLMIDELAVNQLALGNTLFVLISAALAIFSAYVLHGLRHDLHQARKLGQYQLGEKLGEGGMGEVYLAEHQLLKRPCALKLIKPDVNTNPIALARFEREVQAAAMLSHPNTIEIFDYGHTDDGTFYYVMQYLPGLTVSDLVRQSGPMPPGRVIYVMRQVCGALAEAHRYGLVHRDLKPANILVAILGGKCDFAKVLDFGLVKLTATPGAPQLTADYTVSGTPQYMSPEQATATAGVDRRADIYSLGAILYFMLTGRPPFDGANPTELMIAHARDPVVPPSHHRPEIPADLEAVVLRCLAKKPDDRYPDARALAAALAACASAGEWNDEKADQWWIDQATTHIQEASAPVPAAAPA